MPAFVPFLAVSQLQQACGDDPGWVCRTVFEQTGSEPAAVATDFLLGKSLSILAIVLVAVLVNRLARRAIKNALRGLSHGGVRERLGAFRRRTPSALLETGEVSLRATQRIEALATVLRSVISVVVALIAALMVLGELGVNLAPLLAGAGILGIAIGFGSQALVKDFLSGFFILV
jgi:moderate conductance mechanosensitive channel